jgi:hypothetical protein
MVRWLPQVGRVRQRAKGTQWLVCWMKSRDLLYPTRTKASKVVLDWRFCLTSRFQLLLSQKEVTEVEVC